ncbi:hypothetical protein GF323_01220 [Candidatus Woesearchaeota archaeon]|nr:hypothetical protein [Candidatus Woesearchaeota archaeon]
MLLFRKSQIEIQFNWIIVLVAGALIFLFFFGLISWARNNSRESSSATIARNFDSMLTAASVTKSTVNNLTLPIKRLDFSCRGFRIDKSEREEAYANKIIFAPTYIKGTRLITWSLSWDVPFRAANFLFISSPQIRYVFITDYASNEIYRYLRTNFPDELNAEFYEETNVPILEDYNNFKVRITYIGNSISPDKSHIARFKKMGKHDVTSLAVNADTFDHVMDLQFYHKSARGSTDYISGSSAKGFGEASLIGAIFSENEEDYRCSMEKAFSRLDKIAEIYEERARHLRANVPSYCTFYSNSINVLDNIDKNSGYSDLNSLYSHLESDNNNLQQNSCPLIY